MLHQTNTIIITLKNTDEQLGNSRENEWGWLIMVKLTRDRGGPLSSGVLDPEIHQQWFVSTHWKKQNRSKMLDDFPTISPQWLTLRKMCNVMFVLWALQRCQVRNV